MRTSIALLFCLSFIYTNAQDVKLPVIDMQLNLYDEDHYLLNKDIYGLKSPASSYEHYKKSMDMLLKHNIILGVVSNHSSAVNTWKKSDVNKKFMWGTGIFYPGDIDSADFEQMIQNKTITLLGDFPPVSHEYNIYHPGYAPYLALCEKYGVPVSMHLGDVPMKSLYNCSPDPRLSEANPGLLEKVLNEYPNLKIYLKHSDNSFPYYEDLLSVIAKHENLYISLGAVLWNHPENKLYAREFVKSAKQLGAIDKVMFGSGQSFYPHSISFSMRTIDKMGFLTAREKQGIYYDNAAHFLGMDQEELLGYIENLSPAKDR